MFIKKIILFLCFPYILNAHIEVSHIQDIQTFIEKIRNDQPQAKILVAFDLCNTLIMPDNNNGWGSDHWLDAHARRLIEKENIEPKKAWAGLLPIYYEIQQHPHFKVKPVEDTTLTIFNNITQLANVTIGLTARSFPIIDATFRLLFDIGISFKESSKEICIENNFENIFYKDGIIFCGSFNKGTALLQVLDAANYIPDFVIFIDDKLKNIETVEVALSKRSIKNICFHYVYLKDTVENLQLHHEWGNLV